MALSVCEDCGHNVSDLALECPTCGRPMGGTATRASEATGRAGNAPALVNGTATQPVFHAAWLNDLKNARGLPTAVKVCTQCNADVSVDPFRRRIGGGYLCVGCVDEEAEHRRQRGETLTRLGVTLLIVLVAGGMTAGAVHVLPTLQTNKSVKTSK